MIGAVPEKKPELTRIATAGALAAVTLLWAGRSSPLLFQAGTVLLSVCLIPLASGLRVRGGMILGLLFGAVWVAATLGISDRLAGGAVWNWVNAAAIIAMMSVGGLAGGFIGPAGEAAILPEAGGGSSKTQSHGREVAILPDLHRRLAEAMRRRREWLAEWNRRTDPWPSFDQQVRDILGSLTGARRIRCYKLEDGPRLQSLSRGEAAGVSAEGLLGHVLNSRRRYLDCDPDTAPMIRKLAGDTVNGPLWAFPVCRADRPIGLVIADALDTRPMSPAWFDLAAALIEEWWAHVAEADELRQMRLTDPASGLLSRREFIEVLEDLTGRCQAAHEPFVVLAICLEGLRQLDDTGDWRVRDQIVETTGQAVRAALRREDMVGRFSDSLFVAVLRRLDVPLAGMIAENLIRNVQQSVAQVDAKGVLALRAGMSGSGLKALSAEDLLRGSFASLKAARAAGRPLLGGPEINDSPEVKS